MKVNAHLILSELTSWLSDNDTQTRDQKKFNLQKKNLQVAEPSHRTKLLEEVKSLGLAEINLSSLARLEYLECCIKETLRLTR